MKLCSFLRPGDPRPAAGPGVWQGRVGVVLSGESRPRVVDLSAAALARDGAALPALENMLALLDDWDAGHERAESLAAWAGARDEPAFVLRGDDVRLLAPLPQPRSLRDCLAFEGHLVGAMRAVVRRRAGWLAWLDRAAAAPLGGRGLLRPPGVWYRRPVYYKGNPWSVIGPEADVVWPSATRQLDYELEFAAVIGRRARDVSPAEGRAAIAGYTLFNDYTARDVQLDEMAGRLGPAKGKDFDTGNALGPWLVTRDELESLVGPDLARLQLEARVNGEAWSRSSAATMRFGFDQIVVAIAQDETLYPGEVIGSGTVPGGCGLELDRWLRPGDVVELEGTGLGVLRNTVRAAGP